MHPRKDSILKKTCLLKCTSGSKDCIEVGKQTDFLKKGKNATKHEAQEGISLFLR